MAEYLSPWEIAAYQTRQDQASTAYQNSLASNTYQRSMLGIANQRNRDRMGQQWTQYRNQLPGGYARRGLLNSGIYKQALTDYANNRQRSFDDLDFSYTTQLGQYDLDKQNFTNTYNAGLTGIEAERAARRAQLASELRGIM